ncbi:MAG: GNAT family N-acetyltransferase [Acetobacter sp.]|jgi:ribosomal protein S18 acetylase RimI-like enzyme
MLRSPAKQESSLRSAQKFLQSERTGCSKKSDFDQLQFISAQARQRYLEIPTLAHVAHVPPLSIQRLQSCYLKVAVECNTSEIIGFVAVRPLDGLLYLDNISVSSQQSGRGIGAALLQSAFVEAITLQTPALVLTTFRKPT